MPTWGLTAEQRDSGPWGLDPELLLPSKTLTDPVHGDIYLTRLEKLIVDSPPMQRLRRVRQLGTTHIIYPGATHSRLSHALGTLRAAQDLLDAVWNSRSNPQARSFPKTLIAEWEEEGVLDEQFARATVLARLGALLHDLCHVPMGHTVEDDLQLLTPHDGNLARFEALWSKLDATAREPIDADPVFRRELRHLIVSKGDDAKNFQSTYPFVEDIVGNTICADLMDYLQRDHLFTGLPIALGRRFMDSFFVASHDHPHFPGHMVIGIERDGRRRTDIVSELLKYLRYRYELTDRVLNHHAKIAADAMLGKILSGWSDSLWIETAVTMFPSAAVSSDDGIATAMGKVVGLDEVAYPTATKRVSLAVESKLELEFLNRSDDGLLEHVVEIGSAEGAGNSLRNSAALAEKLAARDLFKGIGLASGEVNRSVSSEVFAKFSNPERRRELERDAARFAGIDRSAQELVVWLPDPGMRLKVAEVLVYVDGSIAPLSRVERASQEIVEQHQRLWGVTIYAEKSVVDRPQAADAILAYLGDEMGLVFHRPDGSSVPNKVDLAIEAVLSELHPDPKLRSNLMAMRDQILLVSASDPGVARSFELLKTSVIASAKAAKILPD